jgi:alpha-tubulin suppressor-like RCC1 family protein
MLVLFHSQKNACLVLTREGANCRLPGLAVKQAVRGANLARIRTRELSTILRKKMKHSIPGLILIVCLSTLLARPTNVPFFAGNGQMFVKVGAMGEVSVWGHHSSLGPGDGTRATNADSPVRLGVPRALSAAAGNSHVLILLADGTIVGWGTNAECEVGNGNPGKPLKRWERLEEVRKPVAVTGITGVRMLAASDKISGAVREDGTVWIWGSGNNGLGGNGIMEPQGATVACIPVPRKVEGLGQIRSLSLSQTHAIAVGTDGSVYTWGMNSYGQLGDGTSTHRARPARVEGIEDALDAFAGGTMSAVVLKDGSVLTFGINSNGQLGDPLTNPSDDSKRYKRKPYKVPGVTGVVAISGGPGHVIAQLKDGRLIGWGEGYHGSLGNGSSDGIFPVPVSPTGLGPVVAHYKALRTSFAVLADGRVFVWGPLRMNTGAGVLAGSATPVAFRP